MTTRRSIAPRQPTASGGGPGVTEYATVTDLITASQGSLAPGYYEVPGLVLTKYDGANFDPPLSVIMDHLDDVPLWLRPGDYLRGVGAWTTGLNATGWLERRRDRAPRVVEVSSIPIPTTTLNGQPALDSGGTEGLSTGNDAALNADVPFEVFFAGKLNNMVEINKGFAGKYTGGAGWILGAQANGSPHNCYFNVGGVAAIGSSRLNTDPHVVSGRWTGTELILSVDGVDIDSTPRSSGSSTSASFHVLRYDAPVTTVDALGSSFVFVKKLLTDEERTAIVAELMTAIGI